MKVTIPLIIMFLLIGCTSTTNEEDKSPGENQGINYKVLFKLDEPFMVYQLLVDDSMIYLCDKKYCQIKIYSKIDGKKINTFGKIGKGPGEFDSNFDVYCSSDKLYVCSNKKLSIFTKKGELIREIKDISPYIYRTFIPVQNNYISWRNDFKQIEKGKMSIVYILLDSSLKKIKDIFQTTFKDITPREKYKEPLLLYMPCRKGILYKDKFYIGCTDLGFYIGVFDINGNKLYEIKKQVDKIKITKDIKERNLNFYRVTMGKDMYKRFMSKREIISQEFIPDYMNFFVSNDRIYVIRFPLPGCKGMLECFLLDLEGNILVKKMLMLGGIYKVLEGKRNISFHKGKLYLVIPDSEDKDSIAISVVDIEAMFNYKKND